MIKVDQQFMHDPANGVYGDCQRAVMASILELDIEKVPHFSQIAQDDPEMFWESVYDFLDTQRTELRFISRKEAFEYEGYHEIAGPSPRGNGVWHAVVGYKGEVVFDPHPSRSGVVGDPDTWYYGIYTKDEDEMQVV